MGLLQKAMEAKEAPKTNVPAEAVPGKEATEPVQEEKQPENKPKRGGIITIGGDDAQRAKLEKLTKSRPKKPRAAPIVFPKFDESKEEKLSGELQRFAPPAPEPEAVPEIPAERKSLAKDLDSIPDLSELPAPTEPPKDKGKGMLSFLKRAKKPDAGREPQKKEEAPKEHKKEEHTDVFKVFRLSKKLKEKEKELQKLERQILKDGNKLDERGRGYIEKEQTLAKKEGELLERESDIKEREVLLERDEKSSAERLAKLKEELKRVDDDLREKSEQLQLLNEEYVSRKTMMEDEPKGAVPPSIASVQRHVQPPRPYAPLPPAQKPVQRPILQARQGYAAMQQAVQPVMERKAPQAPAGQKAQPDEQLFALPETYPDSKEVYEIVGLLNEAKGSLGRSDLGRANQIVQQLDAAYRKLGIEEMKKKPILYDILDLKTEISMAMLG
ncbi:MAG: hypothetical protein ABH879_08445 [archaeon]